MEVLYCNKMNISMMVLHYHHIMMRIYDILEYLCIYNANTFHILHKYIWGINYHTLYNNNSCSIIKMRRELYDCIDFVIIYHHYDVAI